MRDCGISGVICFINTSYGRHFVEKAGAVFDGRYGGYRRSLGSLPDEDFIGASQSKRQAGCLVCGGPCKRCAGIRLALLHMRVKIDDVLAQTVSLSRMPVPEEANATTSDSSAFSPGYLHLAIQIASA
ncbi:hypothetical protein CGLAMM_11105 [Acetobacteraceae bacterium EV16G]